jgi:hypothetical protein
MKALRLLGIQGAGELPELLVLDALDDDLRLQGVRQLDGGVQDRAAAGLPIG